MLDRYNRKINYLRISVTDRCNLRCDYCMPPEGVPSMSHDDILTFDEILEFVRLTVAEGVDKIRITGGEPLVRKGIVELLALIAQVRGVRDLGITTNAIVLDRFAGPLKIAGLHRVNVSLDTTDPERYAEITRGGDVNKVFTGIEKAKQVGLRPIKLNCVIKESQDEPDSQLVKKYARDNGLQVRFIHLMDMETGYFKPVEGGKGGDCKNCNRLRLTSDGYVKPCLFSPKAYSIRELGPQEALKQALENKPECGGLNPQGSFYNIGG